MLDRSIRESASRESFPSSRLWDALSRETWRDQPLKGLDTLADALRGWAARSRAGSGLRTRATRIVDASDALKGHSESALDQEIEDARDAVILARNDPRAIDRAFAVAREVVRRHNGLELYPEQIMGALAMTGGSLAEMATGEGKTITAVLPAAIDGWTGFGVHVITVNDYLARRDAKITRDAYRRLGLSVGVLQEDDKPPARRRAYAKSITYAADKQIIFDFLRDRLAAPIHPRLTGHLIDQLEALKPGSTAQPAWDQRVVQRGLNAAIVDEADSVLIDDATTPAIIGMDVSKAEDDRREHFEIARDLASNLRKDEHYEIDTRLHRVFLTDKGRAALRSASDSLPPFWAGPRRREELVSQALNARELYRKGDEYIVRDGKIVIVDPSTGRILEGRQWQLGMHQAIEAKENLEINTAHRTVARISYQRLFQRYRRLAGMTGTASEVAGELWRYYQLPVVRIPTHKAIIRRHPRDRVFSTEDDKFTAVSDHVAKLHAAGRPVLVGTRSVAASERLGQLIESQGMTCRILNAVREAEEADIVAEAGQLGAVTVSTNMAGRGTDILLSDKTRKLGGLAVVGTERHPEFRVDRQLAGRAGRQGDPGSAEFFISLEDQVIAQHGLRWLIWLWRSTHGPVRTQVTRLLWRTAQYTASKRAAAHRTEQARSEAWLDMAMHHHVR